MFWYQNVISFNKTVQWQGARSLVTSVLRFDWLSRDMGRALSKNVHLNTIAPGLGILGIALAIAFLWRRRTPQPAARLTADQHRAVHAYELLRRQLLKHGIQPYNNSAEEILDEVQSHLQSIQAPVEGIVDTYHHVRFGNQTLSRQDFANLKKRIREIRATQRSD